MAFDPSIMIWPDQLRPKSLVRGRSHPVNWGPEVVSGAPQSVAADAGRLRFTYRNVPLYGDHILTFRAVIYELTSPILPIYVPVLDGLRTPRYRASVALPAGVPFSDGSTFSDGTTFYDQPVDFVVTNAAAARASALTLTKQGPSEIALWAGNYIGIGERSYLVKKIWDSADGVAGHYDVTIWPYLREAVAAGAAVLTESPVVKCQIDKKSIEVAEEMNLDRLGYVDIDFIEYGW